jgi:hypothetical protein
MPLPNASYQALRLRGALNDKELELMELREQHVQLVVRRPTEWSRLSDAALCKALGHAAMFLLFTHTCLCHVRLSLRLVHWVGEQGLGSYVLHCLGRLQAPLALFLNHAFQLHIIYTLLVWCAGKARRNV